MQPIVPKCVVFSCTNKKTFFYTNNSKNMGFLNLAYETPVLETPNQPKEPEILKCLDSSENNVPKEKGDGKKDEEALNVNSDGDNDDKVKCENVDENKLESQNIKEAEKVPSIEEIAEKPALSEKVLKTLDSAERVGPGASKTSHYKNPEYFSYERTSFYDAMVEMQKFRLPQPTIKPIKHDQDNVEHATIDADKNQCQNDNDEKKD